MDSGFGDFSGSASDAMDDPSSPSAGAPESTSGADGGRGSSGGLSGEPITTGLIYDVGAIGDVEAPVDVCEVGRDGDGLGPCREVAPPDAFVPMLQWSWAGDGAFAHSIVTPLVANLTDDNGDGEINLCDTPDVLVVVNTGFCDPARIYVLDGATGTEHFHIEGAFNRAATPAIGDIDGDGLPEIVAQAGSVTCGGSDVAAYEHDGTLKWQTSLLGSTGSTADDLDGENAVALADLDNDGDVEIMVESYVLDHEGSVLFLAPDKVDIKYTTTTAADLDGDMDLEVVLGRSAWHHDGTPLFWNEDAEPGQPAIADLDDDGLPEILLVEDEGFTIYEHDGALKLPSSNPTGDEDWRRPAAIHDIDGDGEPEFVVSSKNTYSAYEGDGSQIWTAPIVDASGLASGTAFDFLGDGVAEALYADETTLWIFDGQSGAQVLQAPRQSITIVEYPVVADVDNDGSAEIVVVSNHAFSSPTVQVYRDAEDRWIQARRIWNQHSYHVTNVREDGTIPQYEDPHWLGLNTFRTNAQIEGGAVCQPPAG